MRCPKCGFHSFDYLDACKKCNTDLRPYKTSKKAAAFPPPASPSLPPAASSPGAFEPSASPASTPFAKPQDIFSQEPGPAAPPAAPAPRGAAPPPPISFDLDLGTAEETKVSAFPPGSPRPAPGAPAGIPEFTLDFDTAAKPVSTPDLLAPPSAEEPLSLFTPPPVPVAAPGRSLEWGLPAVLAPAENLLSAPRGGFWIRFVAHMVDGVILSFVLNLISIILFFALGLEQMLPKPGQNPQQIMETFSPSFLLLLGVIILVSLAINAAYYIYFQGPRGQTPGKMICKLKVIQADGQNMTYGKSFLRYLGYALSYLPFWLGFLWVAFDKDKQGFHDKIAKTLVVKLG